MSSQTRKWRQSYLSQVFRRTWKEGKNIKVVVSLLLNNEGKSELEFVMQGLANLYLDDKKKNYKVLLNSNQKQCNMSKIKI